MLLLAELESPTAMIVTSTLYNILTLTTSSCSLHPDIGVHQDTIQHHMINHIILDSTCLLFYFFIFFIFGAGTYTFGAGNLVLENAYLELDRGLSMPFSHHFCWNFKLNSFSHYFDVKILTCLIRTICLLEG